MARAENLNHPFVVWGSCFLWLTSMFAITWSLLLFFYVGDMLFLTGTDLINAIVLLSGIIMLPTNVHIICSIANGKKIDHRCKVVCCPLWLCILWIIAINALGAVLSAHKIMVCKDTTSSRITSTMKYYRSVPKYKHCIDNLQWSLRCCGLNSYRDWFNYDWYDKIRDYEWDPAQNSRVNRDASSNQDTKTVSDSVPLSCCKSGSCISNYLLELGTSSINTRGCFDLMYNIILTSMIVHLIMFLSVCIVEAVILKLIIPQQPDKNKKNVEKKKKFRYPGSDRKQGKFNVKHIMSVKDNFSASSASLQLNPDDSDEFERAERRRSLSPRCKHVRMETFRDFKKIDDEGPESPKEAGKWDDD